MTWLRFVTRAKQIEADRTARYFVPGEQLDIEEPLASRFLAEQSAITIEPPEPNTHADPFLPAPLGDDVLTVACVWKTGSVYDKHDYVGRMARAVARHLTRPYRFVCLTDSETVPEGVERIPLLHGWRGFWSKVELHRPGLFTGPVIYLDLDTVVCGSLDPIADAIAANPILCSWDMQHGWINSSFLAWNADLSCVYDAMLANPSGFMAHYENSDTPWWGDQGHLQVTMQEQRIQWAWVQQVVPHAVSWQAIPLRGKPAPAGVSVSMWYGHPKPHEVQSDWMREHWS
jgi:hypothetical protein